MRESIHQNRIHWINAISMPLLATRPTTLSTKKPTGNVVKLAAEKGVYSEELQNALKELLEQRNWLVHHAMRDSQEGSRFVVKDSLLQKIKSITDKAERLQQLLEWDLIDFSGSKGRDVSKLIEMMIQEKGPSPVGW